MCIFIHIYIHMHVCIYKVLRSLGMGHPCLETVLDIHRVNPGLNVGPGSAKMRDQVGSLSCDHAGSTRKHAIGLAVRVIYFLLFC